MKKRHGWACWISAVAGTLLFAGCASVPIPLVLQPPVVEFASFNSVTIQPEGIQFEVKLRLKNLMPIELPLDRIDYQFDLNHKKLATGALTQFRRLGGRGVQVVTFPFLLEWEDIMLQSASKSIRDNYFVAFHGTLLIKEGFPFAAVPFSMDATLPIPRWPEISLAGTDGSPLAESFSIRFNVKNGNSFPMTLRSVDTRLIFNNKNYPMLQGDSAVECGPHQTQVLALRMTNTLGKGLGMLASALFNQKMDFQVAGRIEFETPFGFFTVPLDSRRLGQKPALGRQAAAAQTEHAE